MNFGQMCEATIFSRDESDSFAIDPEDCTVFYRCVPRPFEDGYLSRRFECPDGTAFDENLDVWVKSVSI